MQAEKVAIIGGGVAAIATVASFRARGINCVAFEKQDGPGGLWRNNYPGAKNQTGGAMYEFPDKKFPTSLQDDDVPAGTIVSYLEEFIQEQGIAEYFRYGVEIETITREADDHWTLHFADDTKETFTYVVICSGLCSNNPNIIELPGRDSFEQAGGIVMHTSERKNNDVELKGKNVVIIGNGKSAVDCARSVAKVAKASGALPPVQLVRGTQWYFPKYLMWFVHGKYAFLSRFGSALLPRYYFDDSILARLAHFVLAPFKFFLWRLMELIFICQYRLPWHMIPNLGTLEDEVFNGASLTATEDDLSAYRTGEVQQRIATIDRLEPGKVVLSNGDTVPCDAIVLGTGWKFGLGVLDEDSVKPLLDLEDDGLWLYRHIVPANVKGLAFVGSNAGTFTNPCTAFIQACWLGDLLAGKRDWPSQENMIENAKREKGFKRSMYPPGKRRGAAICGFFVHYHDLLIRDMGIDPMRYGGPLGTLWNWMLPVEPRVYQDILLHPDARETTPKLKAPTSLYAVVVVMVGSFLCRLLA